MRVLPLRSRLEIRPNHFQQMPFPFNQWFLRGGSLLELFFELREPGLQFSHLFAQAG